MKRNLLLAALAAMLMIQTAGATEPGTVTLEGKRVRVELTLPLRDIKVKSNQLVSLTPALVSGSDTLRLPGVGLMGRNRYVQHLRGNDDGAPVPETIFKASSTPEQYTWHETAPFEPWMNDASLVMLQNTYKCASCNSMAQQEIPLGTDFMLERPLNLDGAFIFVQADAEAIKYRQLSGRANVEFPVNKTVLLPDYRNNAAELSKVRASIDSVRNDSDVTIRSMSITGFASPEGSYSNNERLAKGRTEALTRYVDALYNFPKGLVSTSWNPEDWQGLLQWLQNSNLENRDAIIAIINDNTLTPDACDAKIKRVYPREYSFLLQNVYPALRHTDYRISYTVRSYSDPKEILEVIRTRPGNVSLNEFYVAANSLEPGSALYNEVFDIAAHIYPDDPVANINAANSAMRRGDLESAERYLSKADDRPEAIYSRGLLALMQGDDDLAETLLTRAFNAGVPQAETLLKQLPKIRKFDSINKK